MNRSLFLSWVCHVTRSIQIQSVKVFKYLARFPTICVLSHACSVCPFLIETGMVPLHGDIQIRLSNRENKRIEDLKKVI